MALFENGRGTAGWPVTPGQLIVVDEAAMVPTHQLDQVAGRVIAGDSGKVLLIGDPEQLAVSERAAAAPAPGAGDACTPAHPWSRPVPARRPAAEPGNAVLIV